ncbi:rRNA maturation endonuclease Nob1 [Ammoniphilus resinae]|uniref:rRNA maturation endonuclease Nob1 n=2 Tax=Ammoniphilus resinae TaxID=861532 RepID=A0ABS4GU03_9BACL|nr:rRNA maturation endonuclease Nob1 [Ammoniphilus resinae]
MKGTIDTATRKSHDVLEINKVNSQIKKKELQVERLYQELGEKVFKDPLLENLETQNFIEFQVKNIQFALNELQVMKSKVLYLKNHVQCDSCEKIVSIDTKFCPDCGRNIGDLLKSVTKMLALAEHNKNET